MLKRSGQAHGIDIYLPLRAPGSVVVACFSCPEPGFNMAEICNQDLGEFRWVPTFPSRTFSLIAFSRHLYELFLSADGHLGLRLKDGKINDPDDIYLLGTRAFFPDDKTFYEYLNAVGDTPEVSGSSLSNPYFIFIWYNIMPPHKSTCAKLNAVNLQNKLKFKSCKLSGIVSVNCARQGLFRQGSVADLQRGER